MNVVRYRKERIDIDKPDLERFDRLYISCS